MPRWRNSIVLTAIAVATLGSSSHAEESRAERAIEITNGPLFHSSSADLLKAWNICANAVEGRDFRVDETVLISSGWTRTHVTIDGKAMTADIPGLFSKPGVNALIVADGPACSVEGLSNDPIITSVMSTAIAERVRRIADKRSVAFQTWTSDGSTKFGAKPFLASISVGNSTSYVGSLSSKNLGDTLAVRILTVDPFRSKK